MTALVFTGLAVAVGLLIAAFAALTARRDGSFGWPRWPARYPARNRPAPVWPARVDEPEVEVLPPEQALAVNPARYPARPRRAAPARSALARKARRRRIYGDMRARLAAIALTVAGPVTEAEWDRACRRAGWRPGSEDEEAGT